MNPGRRIVDKDVVNQCGKECSGNAGSDLEIQSLITSPTENYSKGQARGFKTLFPKHLENSGEKWSPLGKKEGLITQILPRTNPVARVNDCSLMTLPRGHHTMWRRREAAGAELPREAPGPKSPRTVTGQDARGPGCRPRPEAASRRGLRSKRRPPHGSADSRELTAWGSGPSTAGSGWFQPAPFLSVSAPWGITLTISRFPGFV